MTRLDRAVDAALREENKRHLASWTEADAEDARLMGVAIQDELDGKPTQAERGALGHIYTDDYAKCYDPRHWTKPAER